jgi:hypothetical protein
LRHRPIKIDLKLILLLPHSRPNFLPTHNPHSSGLNLNERQRTRLPRSQRRTSAPYVAMIIGLHPGPHKRYGQKVARLPLAIKSM